MLQLTHAEQTLSAHNPQNFFWPRINLYIALSNIPQKFLHLVETSIFVNFQSRQKLPHFKHYEVKNYQIGSGSSTIRDVIPGRHSQWRHSSDVILLWERWSTTFSTKMPDAGVVFGWNNTPKSEGRYWTSSDTFLWSRRLAEKKKKEKSGLTSGGTRLRIQDALLSFVPSGRSWRTMSLTKASTHPTNS